MCRAGVGYSVPEYAAILTPSFLLKDIIRLISRFPIMIPAFLVFSSDQISPSLTPRQTRLKIRITLKVSDDLFYISANIPLLKRPLRRKPFILDFFRINLVLIT